MTKYRVELTPDAFNDFKKLDKETAQRILNKLNWLALHYESTTPESLKGTLKNLYKLRVGSWRVLYSAVPKKHLITIHLIGHRKNIYKI